MANADFWSSSARICFLRWSECVKPIVGTETCQVTHLIHVISGRMGVRMQDGSEVQFGPDDVGMIPPGLTPGWSATSLLSLSTSKAVLFSLNHKVKSTPSSSPSSPHHRIGV